MSELAKTTTEVINKQSDFIKLLNKLSETSTSETSKQILDSIRPILLNYFYIRTWDLVNLGGVDSNAVKLFIDTLDQVYPLYLKSLTSDSTNDDQLSIRLSSILNEMVPDIITTINYVAFSHIKFCNKFVEMNGLKVLFNYLNSQILVDNYVENAKNPSNLVNSTMKSCIGIKLSPKLST
jgi:hypothetical protein